MFLPTNSPVGTQSFNERPFINDYKLLSISAIRVMILRQRIQKTLPILVLRQRSIDGKLVSLSVVFYLNFSAVDDTLTDLARNA